MFSFQQHAKLSVQPGSARTRCRWHHRTEISRCRSLASAGALPAVLGHGFCSAQRAVPCWGSAGGGGEARCKGNTGRRAVSHRERPPCRR